VPQRARPQPARVPPDLLTAAAYGVDQFLFVYGDRPTSGARTGQLTVRSMIEELRGFPTERQPGRFAPASRPGRPLPAWKRDADFLFAQVRFSIDEMLEWRSQSTSTVPSTRA
jgi:5,10-methylenetetrahydrofolate reductase